MPNSDTSIILTPSIGNAVLPIIKEQIPQEEYRIQRRIRTVDAFGAGVGSSLMEITIVVASSSPACLAIASIIRKWIQTRSSKKITMITEKGKFEVENLTEKELTVVLEQCKKISFKEE